MHYHQSFSSKNIQEKAPMLDTGYIAQISILNFSVIIRIYKMGRLVVWIVGMPTAESLITGIMDWAMGNTTSK